MTRRSSPPIKDHVSRERVLEALYQAGARKVADPAAGLEGRNRRCVEGVCGDLSELDRRIESASEHWPVVRMAAVDRAVLRLGLWELLNETTPAAVVLNEAVELAKRYSTKESGAFVNGVLAALAAEIRPDEVPAA